MRRFCQLSFVTCMLVALSISIAYAEQPAPMAIAVLSPTPDAPLVLDARDLCEQSTRIEVIEPSDADTLLTLAQSASATPSLELARDMHAQGLEALIVIEPSSVEGSYTIETIGPRGQVHERSTFTYQANAVNYRADLSRTLQEDLATAAPHVLTERERRPKPDTTLATSANDADKTPVPEEDPAPKTPASERDSPRAKPPSTRSEEPTNRPEVALKDDSGATPAPDYSDTGEEASLTDTDSVSEDTDAAASPLEAKGRDLFVDISLGPVVYDLFFGGLTKQQGNITSAGLGLSLLKIKRFPKGGALHTELSSNLSGSSSRFPDMVTTVASPLLPEELKYTSPAPPTRDVPELGLWRTALDFKLDLPSKRAVQLGPALGVEHQRAAFWIYEDQVRLTTGKLGLSMHVTKGRALVDLSFFSQLGRLAVGEGSFSSGISFQPRARFLVGKRGLTLSTGLRLAVNASSQIDTGDNVLSEVRQRLILAEFALGYSR